MKIFHYEKARSPNFKAKDIEIHGKIGNTDFEPFEIRNGNSFFTWSLTESNIRILAYFFLWSKKFPTNISYKFGVYPIFSFFGLTCY